MEHRIADVRWRTGVASPAFHVMSVGLASSRNHVEAVSPLLWRRGRATGSSRQFRCPPDARH